MLKDGKWKSGFLNLNSGERGKLFPLTDTRDYSFMPFTPPPPFTVL